MRKEGRRTINHNKHCIFDNIQQQGRSDAKDFLQNMVNYCRKWYQKK